MQRFLAARNESEPIMYKSNQMHPTQEVYFTIGDENPHRSRLLSLPPVFFLVYVKKNKRSLSIAGKRPKQDEPCVIIAELINASSRG